MNETEKRAIEKWTLEQAHEARFHSFALLIIIGLLIYEVLK